MTIKTERPGGAATPSEPENSIPNRDMETSTMTDTTANVASIAPNGAKSISLDLEALATMDLRDLSYLFKAVNTLGEVAAGLLCQPRFWKDDEKDTTDAGKQVEALFDFLCAYEQACINAATARKPETERDVEERARLLIAFDTESDDSLSHLAKLASTAACEIDDMRRKARRAAA